jgi:hypothetical protein
MPPLQAKLSGGFIFPQQAVGISSASLKRTDVRKISTLEIFLLMRYNVLVHIKYMINPLPVFVNKNCSSTFNFIDTMPPIR